MEETKADISVLTQEATVFTGNIAGLSLINKLENTAFKNDHPLYMQLQQEVFNTATFSQSL
jgi:hypothetical protein